MAAAAMTSRGTANVLTRTTAILAVLFFLTSIGLSILPRFTGSQGSILDRVQTAPSAPTRRSTDRQRQGRRSRSAQPNQQACRPAGQRAGCSSESKYRPRRLSRFPPRPRRGSGRSGDASSSRARDRSSGGASDRFDPVGPGQFRADALRTNPVRQKADKDGRGLPRPFS